MEIAMQNIWVSMPEAAAIWSTLLLVVVITAGVLFLPRRADRAAAAVPEADDERRFAEEVTVAADRAAATAQRRRVEWQQAQTDVDEAWQAYEQADAEARRLAAATAFPVLRRRRARSENADRERYLHHAATAACRRREISIAQLNEALAHRGWNPRLHPVAQEAALRNAVREHRLAAYRAATEREQVAWQTAELAAESLRSLREEALAAKLRVTRGTRSAGAQWWAEQWATTQPVPVVSKPVPAMSNATTQPIPVAAA